jgi:NADH:ubiquinone oxidoreductase subunit D
MSNKSDLSPPLFVQMLSSIPPWTSGVDQDIKRLSQKYQRHEDVQQKFHKVLVRWSDLCEKLQARVKHLENENRILKDSIKGLEEIVYTQLKPEYDLRELKREQKDGST